MPGGKSGALQVEDGNLRGAVEADRGVDGAEAAVDGTEGGDGPGQAFQECATIDLH
jgi:hypothetical protein